MTQHTLDSGAPTAGRTAAVSAPVRPTAERQLDAMVARLREAAPAFAGLSIDDRIGLVRSMQAGYLRIAERSVHAACAAKGAA